MYRSHTLLTLCAIVLLSTAAHAATNVSGAIASDTTWTLAGHPYVVTGNVTVNAGVTLTVDPGVVVKFSADRYLYVNGNLNAQGTSGNSIYFTDLRDDAAGGDTNGDGTATTPLPGGWESIWISNNGTATLDYCVIRYGGAYTGNSYGSIRKTGAGNVAVTNSTVSNSAYYGIEVDASTSLHNISNNTIEDNKWNGVRLDTAGGGTTLQSNTIRNNGLASAYDGVYVINSSPFIQNNTITGNTRYGLYITGTGTPTNVSGNTITANTSGPIYMAADVSGAPVTNSNILDGPLYVGAGSMTTDKNWNSTFFVYYVTGDVTVNAGVTLGIGQYGIVKFAQNARLYVNGTLQALGAAAAPIYFTDYRDDAVGGDTNKDGTASSPAPGWWEGISVANNGSVSLDYCTIRYAGRSASTNPANLYKTGAGNITITNGTISNSDSYGLRIETSTSTHTITANTIENNRYDGVRLVTAGSGTSLQNNTVRNNGLAGAYDGIYVSNSSPAIDGNTITGNTGYGVYATGTGKPTSFKSNTITGNSQGPVYLAPGISGEPLIENTNTLGGPIHIGSGSIAANTVLGGNSFTYYVSATVTVNAGVTLFIAQGTAVKFAQNTQLTINGSLDAQAAAGNLIYFTDYRDDAVGGDSNGDGAATAPASGWWTGIRISANGTATLDYCVARYAAGGAVYKTGAGAVTVRNSAITNNTTGVYISTASPTLTNNTISQNSSNGVYVTGSTAAPTLSKNVIRNNSYGVYCTSSGTATVGGSTTDTNQIFDNTTYGVYNGTSTLTVNATFNYWGSSSGPYHATTNPLGTGNKVSNYVDYGNVVQSVNGSPVITSAGTASGITGQAFSYTITATGTTPMTFGASPLPGGLSLTNETVSGTPSSGGATNVTLTATNAAGTDTRILGLTIYVPPNKPTTPSPANDARDTGLAVTLSWQDGGGATGYDVYFGTTDPPANVASTTATSYTPGTLSPTTRYYWRVDAKGDGNTLTTGDSWSFVTATPPTITSPAAASGTVGVSFTLGLTATGSTPITYTASALPPGLSLSGTAISGTPTAAGSTNLTLTASNIAGTATQSLTITVEPPTAPRITSAASASATVGQPFSYTITASGTPAITFSTGGLPLGLSLTGDTISGTLSLSGQTAISLKATNFVGSDARTLVLTVTQPGGPDTQAPVLTSPPATPQPPVAGQAVTLSAGASDATDGLLMYTWDFGDGTTGTGPSVSHVYTVPGIYTATVTVSDGVNSTTSGVNVAVSASAPPSGGGSGTLPNVFDVLKASVKFNFKSSGKDCLLLAGTIPLEAGFVPSGKTVELAVGDLERTLVLDAKGKGGDTATGFKLAGKLKNGAYTATPAKFLLSLKKQTLFGQLQSLGFVNTDLPKPGDEVTLPVIVSINNIAYLELVTFTYTAKAGTSGSGKKL